MSPFLKRESLFFRRRYEVAETEWVVESYVPGFRSQFHCCMLYDLVTSMSLVCLEMSCPQSTLNKCPLNLLPFRRRESRNPSSALQVHFPIHAPFQPGQPDPPRSLHVHLTPVRLGWCCHQISLLFLSPIQVSPHTPQSWRDLSRSGCGM